MGRYMNGKLTNCPNCGAPIIHSYNYNCNYCGTYLQNTDKSIEKVGDSDIRIKDIEIVKNIQDYSFIIVIYAETCTFDKDDDDTAYYFYGVIVCETDTISLLSQIEVF